MKSEKNSGNLFENRQSFKPVSWIDDSRMAENELNLRCDGDFF